MYDMSTPTTSQRRSAETIWTKPEPGSRRPRYSRQQIAEAAIKIADADGIEAVSMRRVAAELGAGTMTLYYYVPTKRDLLTLIGDTVSGEFLIPPEELSTNWREALTQVARRLCDCLQRRPWVIGSLREARFGPNAISVMEQSLAAVAELPLTAAEKRDLTNLVEDYVLGFVTQAEVLRGHLEEEWLPFAADYISSQLGTGRFPHIEELFDGADLGAILEHLAMNRNERFERGLAHLLDGIELHLSQAR